MLSRSGPAHRSDVLPQACVEDVASALPARADLCTSSPEVPKVPDSDVNQLFDHLVAKLLHRQRNRQAERLRWLHVNHELELVGCSTGRSAGFSPLKMRAV
jgi:hypothetical protein